MVLSPEGGVEGEVEVSSTAWGSILYHSPTSCSPLHSRTEYVARSASLVRKVSTRWRSASARSLIFFWSVDALGFELFFVGDFGDVFALHEEGEEVVLRLGS